MRSLSGKQAVMFVFVTFCATICVWFGVRANTDLSFVEQFTWTNHEVDDDIECHNVSYGALKFPMCIYNANADSFSKDLKYKRAYKWQRINKVLDFAKSYKDVTVVDLGANLGFVTLPMAHSHIKVIAVEPTPETIRRLKKSVRLGKVQDYVTFLPYGISNNKSKMFINVHHPRGHVWNLLTDGPCKTCIQVEIVTMNDLIPLVKTKNVIIKANIEQSEIKAFTVEGAGEFFDKLQPLIVQSEWWQYPKYYNTKTKRGPVDQCVKFFLNRNYDPYDISVEKKLGSDWTNWPSEIVFKRRHLPAKDKPEIR